MGSLDDPLARWVQSAGPIDAYDAHLPVTVDDPLEWFSFAVTSRQLGRASSLAIYHRLVARLGRAITAERVISTDERTLRAISKYTTTNFAKLGSRPDEVTNRRVRAVLTYLGATRQGSQ